MATELQTCPLAAESEGRDTPEAREAAAAAVTDWVQRASASGSKDVAGVLLTQAQAGESDWLPTFGGHPGVTGHVRALTAFDDGSGAALYVGGHFQSGGGKPASRVARWDGQGWSPLGSGFDDSVRALVGFDDGSGPALYAGGEFMNSGGEAAKRIARWDGQTWSELGGGVGGLTTSVVNALATFDDGSGNALYVAGLFTNAGGVPASRIARWDGQNWSALGAGIGSHSISCLAVFDDGSGPALYAGGGFSSAGGQAINDLARWDGQTWSQVGDGVTSFVRALQVFDDGTGAALYAGGHFTSAGGQPASRVARWDGTNWSALGSGMNDTVWSLGTFDDGSGAALYAGGVFTTAGGQPASRIARWSGGQWSSVGAGADSAVYAMAGFDEGQGEALFVGGALSEAGGHQVSRIARWDGHDWSALGGALSGVVRAFGTFDDGQGEAQYVGGNFTGVNGQMVNCVARWDGKHWKDLGEGVGGSGKRVNAFATFDDGAGPALYVGGFFSSAGGQPANNIARWNGVGWSPLGAGVSSTVYALELYDEGSGPVLFTAGFFTSAGGQPANRIARWDGQNWSPVPGGPHSTIEALEVFDDGTGAALYAGGRFLTSGGGTANHISRWDGQSWSNPGTGLTGLFSSVHSLAVHDDGTGEALFVGGYFSHAGGQPANYIARWNGVHWRPVGSGMDHAVYSLTSFDDGSGKALYAGGRFQSAGGQAASRIARWNGGEWSPLGSGVSASVRALQVFDGGHAPTLLAGGDFALSPAGDSYLARWGPAPPSTISPLPGCAANQAELSSPMPALTAGQPFSLVLVAAPLLTGWAQIYLGLDGTDPLGCGLVLPGLGELLLSPAPLAPVALGTGPLVDASFVLSFPVPSDPGVLGLPIAFQGAAIDVSSSVTPVTLSNGLLATISR